MKILVAGEPSKSLEIARALSGKNRRLFIISTGLLEKERLPENCRHIPSDPGSIRLRHWGLDLTDEDVLMVIDNEPAAVRRTIHNLRAQASTPDLVVISDDETLRGEFPDLLIRSDAKVYQDELREVLKRVNTRKRLAEMRALVDRVSKVLILIWGNPDPDAIASAFALKVLIGEHSNKVRIVYAGEFTRPENKAMVDVLEIPMEKFEPDSMFTPGTSVFTVDAQPSFFRYDPPISFDVVIDHHPKTEEPVARIVDIRSSYGATSTILTEYFVHSRTKIPRRVATALWYGLKTDTNDLTRNVNESDIRAFRVLKAAADEDVVRSIELSQMPVEVLDTFAQAIAAKEIAGEVVFTHLGRLANPDYAVYVSDFFLRLWKISVSIASAQSGSKLVVVFRSDGLRHDVGRIAERVFSKYGTAGGHRTMARAELEWEKVSTELPDPSNDDAAIKKWLIDRLAIALGSLADVRRTGASRSDAA